MKSHVKIGSNVRINNIFKKSDASNTYTATYLTQVEFIDGDCHYKYTQYMQKENESFEKSTDDDNSIKANCGFDELVRALDKEGVYVKDVALSPKKMFYVSVGTTENVLKNIVALP